MLDSKPALDSSTKRLPVTVLTGFLGVGKTTLLNRILREANGRRYAVIVNEFGEIGIDGGLIVHADEEVFELANGCICCSVRGDLLRVIEGLLKRRDRLDAIVVETTGLADPAPVALSFFTDTDLQANTHLDAIVTVVDALHVGRQLASASEAATQIASADVVVLTKTHLASSAQIEAAHRHIRGLNDFAPILTDTPDLPLSSLLDRGSFDLRRLMALAPEDDGVDGTPHLAGIDNVCLRTSRDIDPYVFLPWLEYVLLSDGPDIFRTKGILAFRGDPDRFVFHAVHMMSEGLHQRPWEPNEPRESRLVFIGRNLDRKALASGFAACRAIW